MLVHQAMAATLDTVLDEIRGIQERARAGEQEPRSPGDPECSGR